MGFLCVCFFRVFFFFFCVGVCGCVCVCVFLNVHTNYVSETVTNLKQNEAQSARAESTHKGVNARWELL